MTRWYSPKLSRELVSKLYFRARAERIPMTVLANRIIQQKLEADELVECRRDTASDIPESGEHAGPVRSPAIAPR